MDEKADAFESMAGICKFIALEKFDPEFYQKHFDAIEFANSFSRVLATNYPALDEAFRKSLTLPTHEGGELIAEAFYSFAFPEDKIEWLDNQMTEVMRVLYMVVKDDELPAEFDWVRYSIITAFE